MSGVLGWLLAWRGLRPPPTGGFGTIGAFPDADALTAAVRAARAAGWTRFDAHAPHPVPDAAEAMGVQAAPVGWAAVAAGVAGGAAAWGLSWYLSAVDYPLNVGGRPPHGGPALLPAAYIVAVLVAAVAALLAMLWLNGLPRLHHPIFHARGFHRAGEDRFFLWLDGDDPLHAPGAAEAFLQAQGASGIAPVRAS